MGRDRCAVFEREGAAWAFRAELASAAVNETGFGGALDLEGDRLVVGSRFEDPYGAVYVIGAFGGRTSSNCTGAQNSEGDGARVTYTGSTGIEAADSELHLERGVPGQFAVLC